VSTRPARKIKVPHQGKALLLRVVPYNEADMIVALLVEPLGRVSALARGARRMHRTSALSLEPMHTLQIKLDELPGAEMMTLKEAKLDTVRLRLTRRLPALEAAGKALRWVRDLSSPRCPEAEVWEELTGLLDRLDAPDEDTAPELLLAGAGLRLLQATGYGLSLRACVHCGKTCPAQAPAGFDAARGGLVCTACGGGPFRMRPELRQALLAVEQGDDGALPLEDAEAVTRWVDRALATHGHTTPARDDRPRNNAMIRLWSEVMVDPVLATRPVRVKAPRGARVFEIHWADQYVGQIPHAILRGYCPCAGCQGHSGTIRFVPGGDLELEQITPVGNYALQLVWGDQHGSGLYSFRYLRALSELAERSRDSDERPEMPRL
jgi:DNA repair protein RecO (recombination protein O)